MIKLSGSQIKASNKNIHLVLSKIFIILFGFFYAALLLQIAIIGSRDLNDYLIYFNCLPTNSCEIVWEVEHSAKLMASIFQPIFGSIVVIYLYIYLAILVKLFAFYKMQNKYYAFIIYNLSFVLLLEVTQIRAAVAIAFAIASLGAYLQNRKVFAGILFALGIYFHNSIILLILILFPIKYIFIALIIFIISSASIEKLTIYIESIDPRLVQLMRINSLRAYFENQVSPSIINVKNLMAVMLLVPLVLRWMDSKERSIVLKGYILYVLSLCGIYFYSADLFSRISDIYLVITLIYVAGYLRGHAAYKIILLLCALITFISSLKIIGISLIID